ncbi:30S ribosomal protein S18 [Candidatus Azambacteria bacterium]|nr:30S ribosomal protein S18 [Candidatus Azambacteria bacterium]
MAKHCYFCSQNIFHIDYKNTDLIRRFLTSQAKILTPQRTDNCATLPRSFTIYQ